MKKKKKIQNMEKPHAVCVPLPGQSHINAMLKLAKILHSRGFYITFVYTQSTHQSILKSRGPHSLDGLSDFRFETIPDGSPDAPDFLSLIQSMNINFPVQVDHLITKLNQSAADAGEAATEHNSCPPVSCLVSDIILTCTTEVAQQHGIPQVLLWPMSASVLLTYLHSQLMADKGLFPLKDKSYLTNGYLDMPVDFIPGLNDMRLKDFPSLFWDGNDALNANSIHQVQRASKASAVILNTFDALETEVLQAIKPLLPSIYTLGPLNFLEQKIPNKELKSFGSNFLKENQDCIGWLDSKPPGSVVYVSFGSFTPITREQRIEFAWGLANSKYPFLWVITDNLVVGDDAILPQEFIQETTDRSMITGWCPQEQVLGHSAIGGFLTHCGWNSIMDAMCNGVPLICWPFMGDQQTNSRTACVHWGIGIELDKNVIRDEVERCVRALIEDDKGKELKTKAMEWKQKADKSTKLGGSSYENLDKIVMEVLVHKKLE